jgi:GINS complex subunit 3
LVRFAFSNNPTQSPLVTLDFPAPLQSRVVNALEADPKSVDIRAQAPHFYALGAKILELFDDDQIVDVLLKVRKACIVFYFVVHVADMGLVDLSTAIS